MGKVVEITPVNFRCVNPFNPRGCPAVFNDISTGKLLIVGKMIEKGVIDSDILRGRIAEDETVVSVPADMIFDLNKEQLV